jgi:hypothetical protein
MIIINLSVFFITLISCRGAPVQEPQGDVSSHLESLGQQKADKAIVDQQASVKTENEKPIEESDLEKVSENQVENEAEEKVEESNEVREEVEEMREESDDVKAESTDVIENGEEDQAEEASEGVESEVGKVDPETLAQDVRQWEYPDEQNEMIPAEWYNNPTTRRWLYYHLLQNRRRKRHVTRPVALTAEDMNRAPSPMRVKRGAYYDPYDTLGFTPEDLGYTGEYDREEEPFEDMSEEDLVRALKILHGLYREELQRMREEEAIKELMENTMWENNEESNYNSLEDPYAPAPLYVPYNEPMRKRQAPFMSMVPGNKRGYEEVGWWGNFVQPEREKEEEEYERIMELAKTLNYN